jgi:hypothetical protein
MMHFEFTQEDHPDSVNGIVVLPVPCVRVKDLKGFIISQLIKYNENCQLAWHGGRIPNDEIWLKFGGDKGQGSTKLCIQIANL